MRFTADPDEKELKVGGFAVPDTLTPIEIIDRMRRNLGVKMRGVTVDRIIAGNPGAAVTGVAVMMMATYAGLRDAAARNCNFVITHEPTFFSHQDETDSLLHDDVYREKLEYIRGQGLTIYHFHDQWHDRDVDGIAYGMAKELGWDTDKASPDYHTFSFTDKTLGDLRDELAEKLHARHIRVIGDPEMKVRKVAVNWGFMSRGPGIASIAGPDTDAVIAGETHEWEAIEYVQDAVAMGRRKALIVLGHVVSEQAGMKYCAEWLRGFITEVPVVFVPNGDPFV